MFFRGGLSLSREFRIQDVNRHDCERQVDRVIDERQFGFSRKGQLERLVCGVNGQKWLRCFLASFGRAKESLGRTKIQKGKKKHELSSKCWKIDLWGLN